MGTGCSWAQGVYGYRVFLVTECLWVQCVYGYRVFLGTGCLGVQGFHVDVKVHTRDDRTSGYIRYQHGRISRPNKNCGFSFYTFSGIFIP